MKRRAAIWLALMAGGLVAPAAWAGGTTPEEEVLGQLRRIGPDTAGGCIGDPRTPVCALDTLYACIARLDFSVCKRVGQGPEPNEELIGQGPSGHDVWYESIIERVIEEVASIDRAWIDRTFPELLRPDYAAPGDIQVTARHRTCLLTTPAVECTVWDREVFVFQRAGSGDWHLVYWIQSIGAEKYYYEYPP